MFEKQRKPGPKKTKEKTATSHITIRVCTDEKIRINEIASELGMNQSDFLREAIVYYANTVQKKKVSINA